MLKKLIVATVGAGATAVVAVTVAFACVSVAAVQSISPSSGPQGTHVTMNFSGFNSMGSQLNNGTTKVYFGGQQHGVLVAQAPTAQNFSVSFDVPSGFAPGNYLIEAVSTGYNSSTYGSGPGGGPNSQKSQQVTRTVFNMTPGVASANGTSSSSSILQQANQNSPYGQDQVRTLVVNQGVTRPGGVVSNKGGAVQVPQSPVTPGQAVNLASSGVGSALGLVLLLLGVAVLATSVAVVGAVGISRVLQPERQRTRERI